MWVFVKKNYRAIILVLFVIVSEVIYLPFSKYLHHGYVTWGDVLYHFFAQIGYVSFLPSLFLYWSCRNIDSKGIYLGLVFWNIIEITQELNSLLSLNIGFFVKSSSTKSDVLQIIFITFTVLLTYKGYKGYTKWNTSHRS